jgi:hypothetical protein
MPLVLDCFIIDFWDENQLTSNSSISVEVYAPLDWDPDYFLKILDDSIQQNTIVYIFNTYCINGIDFPFNTLNTIHHKFKKKLGKCNKYVIRISDY